MYLYSLNNNELVEESNILESHLIFIALNEKTYLINNQTKLYDNICKAKVFDSVNRVELIDDNLLVVLNRFIPNEDRTLNKILFNVYSSNEKLYIVYGNELNFTEYINKLKELLFLCFNKELPFHNGLFLILSEMLHFDKCNLEVIEDDCFLIETNLVEDIDGDYFIDILNIKKVLAMYKKAYFGLEEVFLMLSSLRGFDFSEVMLGELYKLYSRTKWLSNEVNTLVEYTGQLRDLYHSLISESMDKTMSLFTVISAIFLPLTLLVGWYGMNFTYMYELKWRYGYLYVGILSILIIVILLVIFKVKKFLKW